MYNKLKLLWLSSRGMTLIEIIVSIAILGVVIIPVMNLFVMSAKINSESDLEYRSSLCAQRYIEEIIAMTYIDTDIYIYDADTNSYNRIVVQTDNDFGAEIKISPEGSFLLNIEVKIILDGEVVNELIGSKLIKQ